MPTEHKAVECWNCKKMSKSSDQYIVVASIEAEKHLPDDMHPSQKFKLASAMSLKDVAFCDGDCLAESIHKTFGSR